MIFLVYRGLKRPVHPIQSIGARGSGGPGGPSNFYRDEKGKGRKEKIMGKKKKKKEKKKNNAPEGMICKTGL